MHLALQQKLSRPLFPVVEIDRIENRHEEGDSGQLLSREDYTVYREERPVDDVEESPVGKPLTRRTSIRNRVDHLRYQRADSEHPVGMIQPLADANRDDHEWEDFN